MRKSSKSRNVLHVQGEMTIYRAAEHAQEVLGAVRARAADLRLDLSAVTELDTSGLQILLMAQREAAAVGTRVGIVGASPCVQDVLGLCSLTARFAADQESRK